MLLMMSKGATSAVHNNDRHLLLLSCPVMVEVMFVGTVDYSPVLPRILGVEGVNGIHKVHRPILLLSRLAIISAVHR